MSERSKGACDKPTSMPQNKEYDEGYDRIFSKKYELHYSNGTVLIRTFKSQKEANDFCHYEGDHLIRVREIK